ncbi:MAG TPA: HNH endonuclease family protein [Candidatus Saccharimonadales bacterium]|nr:HNH endonuclease family protein [Candidatus Saccharimonadales bacterium]
MKEKQRRTFTIIIAVLAICLGLFFSNQPPQSKVESEQISINSENALVALEKLQVKGRAPKTDYSRDQFGDGWDSLDGCDVRNLVLKRDLTESKFDQDGCTVLSGKLHDPYSEKQIDFTKGEATSQLVQIDHVVALSDAWQKGAQDLSAQKRQELANDSLNLLAVDGKLNQQKSDSDAASWLPPNKNYRCAYVARQIAVKTKYLLWVTSAEYTALKNVLQGCPDQVLPVESG